MSATLSKLRTSWVCLGWTRYCRKILPKLMDLVWIEKP